MPGGRRNPGGRGGPGGRMQFNICSTAHSSNGGTNGGSVNGTDDKRVSEPVGGRPLAPKHVPIPAVPVDGQLMFEALSLGVSIIAACLQLLNLYRTVWWLPQSYNEYSMVCLNGFLTIASCNNNSLSYHLRLYDNSLDFFFSHFI